MHPTRFISSFTPSPRLPSLFEPRQCPPPVSFAPPFTTFNVAGGARAARAAAGTCGGWADGDDKMVPPSCAAATRRLQPAHPAGKGYRQCVVDSAGERRDSHLSGRWPVRAQFCGGAFRRARATMRRQTAALVDEDWIQFFFFDFVNLC